MNKTIPDIKLHKGSTNTAIIIAGGDGDDKDTFDLLIDSLREKGVKNHFITFSYSGLDDPRKFSLPETVNDLKEILDFSVAIEGVEDIKILATSMGAYCTSIITSDPNYSRKISEILFLDPADCYLDEKIVSTWEGPREYKLDPSRKTASQTLRDLTANTKIHIAHLTLRNYGPDGYIEKEYKDRGKDHESMYPRLNTNMVKSFYENTPEKNRGEYREVKDTPHGIFRDGDIEKNIENIGKLIMEIL